MGPGRIAARERDPARYPAPVAHSPDPRDADEPPELPTSLVPRWLALLVLVALLLAAGFSVVSLLSSPPSQPPAAERATP